MDNIAENVSLHPILKSKELSIDFIDAPTKDILPIKNQLIVSMLEGLLKKLIFVGSLTPNSMQSINEKQDELSKFVKEELLTSLMDYRKLERRYQELVSKWDEVEPKTSKNRCMKEIQIDLQNCSQALKQKFSQIVHYLKEHPYITGDVLKLERERRELIHLIERTIQDFVVGEGAALNHRVRDDRGLDEMFEDASNRESQTVLALTEVQDRMKKEEGKYQEEFTTRHQQITEKKKTLEMLKYKVLVELKCTHRETKARLNAVERSFKLEENELLRHYQRLQREQEMQTQVHEDLLHYLRDRLSQVERDITAWTQKSHQDFQGLNMRKESLEDSRQSYMEQLTYLRARQKVALEEEEVQKENERLRLEKEAEIKRLFQRQQVAARKIQKMLVLFLHVRREKKKTHTQTPQSTDIAQDTHAAAASSSSSSAQEKKGVGSMKTNNNKKMMEDAAKGTAKKSAGGGGGLRKDATTNNNNNNNKGTKAAASRSTTTTTTTTKTGSKKK